MRTLLATLALLLPVASNAASVSLLYVDATGGHAYPGSTITLEVRVTANAGEMDNAVFGALNYSDSLVDSRVALNEQFALPGGGWSLGAAACTTAFCTAFSQVRQEGAIAVDVTDFVIARVRFTIDPTSPIALYNFTWRTSPTTQRLDFFGVTNAPGIGIFSDQPPVPEPATAALLALGLAGLAFAARSSK